MQKFRKKPVVIEAVQYNNLIGDYGKIVEWMKENGSKEADEIEWASPSLLIPTLEGVMSASPGDYIIRGVNGEYYPCKPNIFEKTYEPVDECEIHKEQEKKDAGEFARAIMKNAGQRD